MLGKKRGVCGEYVGNAWGICREYVGNYSLVVVRFSNGEDKYFLTEGTGVFSAQAVLPSGLSCSQCVLQWRYVAGNNWGRCRDGEGRVGCGPQEEFRACADLRLTGGATPLNTFPTISISPLLLVTSLDLY